MVVIRIHRAYQHLNRYRQILTVLIRYGLAEGFDRLGLEFAQDLLSRGIGKDVVEQSYEQRVRSALTELGPTFIKLGQVLSVRPDLAGVAMAAELKSLQKNVPADPFDAIRKRVESELGAPLEQLYTAFEERPLASASMGQTHRATLPDGRPVVVKVRHLGVVKKVRVDLEILLDLADLIESRIEESRVYRPRDFVEQFRQSLLRELDFRHEARNLEQFCALLGDEPGLRIPAPILSHTSHAVLTMEWLEGVHASEPDRIRALGADPAQIALRGGEIFLKMVFDLGRFHADPHPGNILVLPDGAIGLLDFGTVGRLSDEMREDLEDFLVALVRQQGEQATDIIVRLGSPPPDLDTASLRTELLDLSAYYTKQSLAELDVGALLSEVTELIRKHRILLPPAVSMLIKVLITLEGTGRALSPEFNLAKLLEPYQMQVVKRRFSPERQLKRVEQMYRGVERFAQVVPSGIVDIVGQLKRGDLSMQVEHRGLEDLRLELRRTAESLTLGILAAALILGSSLLFVSGAPPLAWGYPLLGLAGLALGGALTLRLLWAIGRMKGLRSNKRR
jgi:ubiquinone biosynthesis protein